MLAEGAAGLRVRISSVPAEASAGNRVMAAPRGPLRARRPAKRALGEGTGSPEGARGVGVGAGRGRSAQVSPPPPARRARGTTWLAMRFDLLTSSLARGAGLLKGLERWGPQTRAPTRRFPSLFPL